MYIQFVNANFFRDSGSDIAVVSDHFELGFTLCPQLGANALSQNLEQLALSMLIAIGVTLILVFVLGFLKLQQNRNLVWLQISFLQTVSCLALVNMRIPTNLLNLLLSLSALVRIDFLTNWLSTKADFFPDLSINEDKLVEFDRFEKFGHSGNAGEHIGNILVNLAAILLVVILFNLVGRCSKNTRCGNLVKYVTTVFTF